MQVTTETPTSDDTVVNQAAQSLDLPAAAAAPAASEDDSTPCETQEPESQPEAPEPGTATTLI